MSKAPLVRKFEEEESYTQPCGPNCLFGTLLPKGVAGDLNVGRVRMTGPTWNEPGAHDKWHQIYIVLSGLGTMVIDEKEYPISGPTLIEIPFNTRHFMKLDEGQEMEYLYVNQHLE